jgi:hypothetical protein
VAVGVASPTSNADITVDITTRTNLLAISRLSGSSRKRRNLFWRINGVHICHDGSEGVVVCLFICLQGFHCLCLLRPVRLYELFGHISLMSFVELVIRDVISGAPPPTPPSPPAHPNSCHPRRSAIRSAAFPAAPTATPTREWAQAAIGFGSKASYNGRFPRGLHLRVRRQGKRTFQSRVSDIILCRSVSEG